DQANRGDQRTQQHSSESAGGGPINSADQRNQEEREDSAHADGGFNRGVYLQRMLAARNFETRQPDAPNAQSSHADGQQCADRNGGRSDGQLQKLIPDDLVNQRGTAAARK